MAKFRAIRNSLLGGEISSTADGRTDLALYPHACKVMKNVIPFSAGGAYMRPGTMYQGQHLFTAGFDAPVMIPFVASDNTEYMCVFLPQRSGGGGANIVIYAAENYAGGIVFGQSAVITTLTGISWTRADAQNARYKQIGDILYLATPNQAPIQIRLSTAGVFSIYQPYTTASLAAAGGPGRDSLPYKAQNTTAVTMAPSAVAGAITITASAAHFVAADVGGVIKMDHAGTYGAAIITGFTSTTVVNATVIANFGGVGAVTTWWESAWSPSRGWPGTVEFYRNRVGYGGWDDAPDSIAWSEFGDYSQYSHDSILDPDLSPVGTQAFTLTMLAGQRARIRWMKAAKSLLVGTDQSEWLIDAADGATTFARDNSSALRQSEYGGNGVIAYTGSEIFFVSHDGATIRSLAFDYYNQAYIAEEVQSLYTEFPGAPPLDYYLSSQCAREITRMEWDSSRNTLWCIDNAGNLRGLTRIKKAQVSLWHSHELGGYDADSRPALADVDADHPVAQLVCEGALVGIACIQDLFTKKQNVWVAVRRYMSGNWVWSIETMRGGYIHATSAYSQILASQMLFTDCSKIHKCTASVTTYAVAHLEDRVVRATANSLANGLFALVEGTVDTGVVQDTAMHWTDLPAYPGPLDGEYWIAFGLPYRAIIQPTRIEAGSQVGSAQGAMKRVHKFFVRFYKTIAAKAGSDEDRLETLNFRLGSTVTGKSAELFTGDKEVLPQSDFDRDGYLWIEQDEPLPFGVTCIVAEGQTYD